jgi:hypothetical protein
MTENACGRNGRNAIPLTISLRSAKMIQVIPQANSSVPARGPVAQLGARFHGMEEVVGSIPTRSTKSLSWLLCTSCKAKVPEDSKSVVLKMLLSA